MQQARSNTSTSFETDPSNFMDDPSPMPSDVRHLENLIESKLNALRQDITGFSTLKADLDSLKRDALLDALLGQLDRKLAEWTVDIGLASRASIDEHSLHQIQNMLEVSSRRILDQVVGSLSMPQLEASISEVDKEGLVDAIVAASHSSAFSPMLSLQSVTEQLQTWHTSAAKHLDQLAHLVAANANPSPPSDTNTLYDRLAELSEHSRRSHYEHHLLPALEELKTSQRTAADEHLQTLNGLLDKFRDTKDRDMDEERLQSMLAKAIQDALPPALQTQREHSETRLKEILNAVLAAIASSEQEAKLTHNNMGRFNDELSNCMQELRRLGQDHQDVPREVDTKRIVHLETCNEDLQERLQDSKSALREQENISQRQALETDKLRRRVQELEHENAIKEQHIQDTREHHSKLAAESECGWKRQIEMLESRLESQVRIRCLLLCSC